MAGTGGRSWLAEIRDAALVVAACAVAASLINWARPDGIPFVQKEAYAILVPCPETAGRADPVQPAELGAREPALLLIDARPRAEFDAGHTPGAWSVPYDYLEPTDPETLRRIAASGARRVVVIGDGADPDSGEQLAKEIAGKGIRNVGFVVGGAPALGVPGAEGGAP